MMIQKKKNNYIRQLGKMEMTRSRNSNSQIDNSDKKYKTLFFGQVNFSKINIMKKKHRKYSCALRVCIMKLKKGQVHNVKFYLIKRHA